VYIIYFVVQPMPGNHVVQQMLYDGALMVLLGILTAFMNRAPEQPAQPAQSAEM
jgi:energy-converting hydrogenase Eha subunit E